MIFTQLAKVVSKLDTELSPSNTYSTLNLLYPGVVAVTNCTEPVEMVGVPENPRTETFTEFTTDPNPTTAYGGGNGEVGEENFTLESLEEFQGYQVSVRVWNREGSGPENDVMTICVTTLEDGETCASLGVNGTGELNYYCSACSVIG